MTESSGETDRGIHFLLTKRTGKKPNCVSQEIVSLRSGRFYSMKMFVADYQDLLQAKSEKKLMAVSVDIKNVEMIPSKSFVSEVLGQETLINFIEIQPYLEE